VSTSGSWTGSEPTGVSTSMVIPDVPLLRDSTSISTSVTLFAASVRATSPLGNVSFADVGWTTTPRSSSHSLVRLRRSVEERPVSVNVNGLGVATQS
jgi:hypothetical protein